MALELPFLLCTFENSRKRIEYGSIPFLLQRPDELLRKKEFMLVSAKQKIRLERFPQSYYKCLLLFCYDGVTVKFLM